MIRQLSIYAENKKGAMKKITAILSGAGVNILSFVTNDSAEFGIIRMLVSDDDAAEKALTEAGYLLKRTSVLGVEVSDEPGSLDRLLGLIENANINIDYLYTSFDRQSAGPVIVIRAGDMDELEAFLAAHGFSCREMV